MTSTAHDPYSELFADSNPFPPRRFTRAEYDSLIESGFFGEDERTELLHGLILVVSPQGPSHTRTIGRLMEQLLPALVGRAQVLSHSPLAAADDAEPEPDVLIFPRGQDESEHPHDVFCAIEVAVTSQARDRAKVAIYARANVPQLILIDVPRREARIYREPRDGDYGRMDTLREGARVVIDAFPDVGFDLAEVLPKATAT